MSSDDDEGLFDSDSDDTAELIKNSKVASAQEKKAPAKKKKEEGGLFDSDEDDDSDDGGFGGSSKKQRMEALAAKKKRQIGGSSKKKKGKSAEKDGFASDGSYDSEDFQRTKDDDDFIDKSGDADGVNELYAEQNFNDDEIPDKKKKKKKRRAVDGAVEPDNPVDLVIERMKKKKKIKKGRVEIEEEVKLFLNKMDTAAEDDRIAREEGRPGTNRLKIHREVFETMNQQGEFQTLLLEFDLLSVCKRWIEPLPNGQLNNLTIVTKMLEAVGKLPVSSSDLKRSGFGKTLMVIGKNSKLPADLKAVIRSLVEKWTRPILKKSGTLKDYDPSRRNRGTPPSAASLPAARSPDTQNVASLIAKGKKAKPMGTQRVQVPYGKGFDFHIRPADRSVTQKPLGGETMGGDVRKQLKKRMVEKSRTVGKNQRSANVSVEGRKTK